MRVFRKDNEGEVGEKGIKVVFVVGVCVCVLREPKYVRLFGDKCIFCYLLCQWFLKWRPQEGATGEPHVTAATSG